MREILTGFLKWVEIVLALMSQLLIGKKLEKIQGKCVSKIFIYVNVVIFLNITNHLPSINFLIPCMIPCVI